MNAVQKWATVVCLATLAGAVVELLIPPGKLEQTVRFVLGAFLLCALLNPLLTTANGIRLDLQQDTRLSENQDTNFSQQVEEQMEQEMKRQLEGLIRQTLEEESLSANEIEIFMDTDDQDRILITRLTVHLSQELTAGKTKQLLEDKLGIPIEIVIDKG